MAAIARRPGCAAPTLLLELDLHREYGPVDLLGLQRMLRDIDWHREKQSTRWTSIPTRDQALDELVSFLTGDDGEVHQFNPYLRRLPEHFVYANRRRGPTPASTLLYRDGSSVLTPASLDYLRYDHEREVCRLK